MKRNDAHREAKYTNKYVASTVSLKVASQMSGMRAGYSAFANLIVAMETSVQTILNGATAGSPPNPIPTPDYPFYFAFARQIWARQHKGIQGLGLKAEAQALKDDWKNRGLDDTTLKSIASDVFTLTLT